MRIDFSNVHSYGIEGMVILFSVILSFYVEGQRDLAEINDNKDKLILDLINSNSQYFGFVAGSGVQHKHHNLYLSILHCYKHMRLCQHNIYPFKVES